MMTSRQNNQANLNSFQRMTEPAWQSHDAVAPIHALTGLRFLAAAAVFIYHVDGYLTVASHRFPLGATAVSFFFVLSGYILTYVYYDRLREQPMWGSDTRRFLVTRWARLWPLHLTCLVLALVLAPFSGFAVDWNARNSVPSFVANLLMIQSWIPVHRWFLDFNSVSWSISTEMFFYLTFPFLLAARRRFPWVIAGTLALALAVHAVWQTATSLPAWFSVLNLIVANPLTQLYQFALGMGMCLLRFRFARRTETHPAPPRRRRAFVLDTLFETLAIVLLPLTWWLVARDPAWLADQLAFTGLRLNVWLEMSALVPAFAILIYVFGVCRGFWSCVLGSRLAVWLGDISFAFYMVHQLVIVALLPTPMNNFMWVTVSFLLALFSSALLFRVVEMPMKSALLAAWDGRYEKVPRHVLSGWRSMFFSPFGLIQLAVFSGLVTVAIMNPPREPDAGVRHILARNQLPGEVRFEHEATLVGLNCQLVGDVISLQMVWRKFRSQQRNRFLHVCDEEGVILRQPPAPFHQLRAAPAFQYVSDVVILPREAWHDGAWLAIGFWNAESQAARVIADSATPSDYRFRAVDLEPFRKELARREARDP